jgi:hypothetical protein
MPEQEELRSPEIVGLVGDVVSRLRGQAPGGYKCIFLNCEMHETPGGMTTSGDLFAITRPWLGPYRRNQWVLDANSLLLLNRAGRVLMAETKQDHTAIDVLINRNGFRAFVDRGSLRRIGGDDFYKSKHKSYLQLEPLLSHV